MCSRLGLQPGGLAQGSDEKYGRLGLLAGFDRRRVAPVSAISVIQLSSQRARAALGRRGPGPLIRLNAAGARRARKIRADRPPRTVPCESVERESCCTAQQIEF